MLYLNLIFSFCVIWCSVSNLNVESFLVSALDTDQGSDTEVEYREGDLINEMDAHHVNKNIDGVREHIDTLNDKYFGKKKLFTEKDQMEAHARKGVRNKLREKRQAEYKEHKRHATRIRNGEL
mmetsp:Transcript_17210/g.28803  ORF Transcript_17210/g.28803 Transcript_17210/m.28803 type:complete len:123 (-) Transcript_17210:1927-2295(-)